jgi:transcriptional regulator with XRE-family HTH domain
MSGTKKRQGAKSDSEVVKRLDVEISRLGFTTDKEFSAHSGVSASTVSRLRSGERGMDIETAVKIARGLGRSVDWLLTGEEERRPRIFTFTETSLETIRDALDIAIEDAKARKGRED